jgi:hypothetical protein
VTVGIGTGFDEEAVKRDLATIAAVEQAEAEKSDVWCEEHPPRVDGRTPWRTEEVSCLKAAMHAVAAGTPGRWNMIAEMVPGRDASDCKGRGSKLNTHKAGALIPSTDMLSESSEDEANVEDGESCSEGSDGDEVERLKECIENFPTDGERSELGELFDDLGRALKAMGDDSGAEKAWRDGTRRVPAHFRCYAGLARMLRSRNDLMGAESIVRKGLKLELHEENDCLLELAAIQATRGDHARAEETYRKAMSAMPGDGLAYLQFGEMLEIKEDMGGAESVYRAGIELIPDFAEDYSKFWRNVDDHGELGARFPALEKLLASSIPSNRN